jgi:DNA polymerase I-like protein with 3'-5' exonuclease and polymerase domains
MIRKGRIAEVQKILWNRYVGVKEWQNRTIEKYKQLGYVEGISGFRRYGPLNINKIYNTPVQGPSFHLTLNSLITLDYDMNSVLHQYGFRSEPIFEVHDSIPFNAVPEEAKDLVQVVSGVMTYKAFSWQRNIVSSVNWEIGVNNWYDLRKLVFRSCNMCGATEAPQGQNIVKLDGGGKEEHYICGYCRKEEIIAV